MTTSVPVYTTDSISGTTWDSTKEQVSRFADILHESHCFYCQRHTDHFAEHDDAVDLGLASYSRGADGKFNGDVERTELYYTPLGQQIRNHMDDAVDIWCKQASRGVPMIKITGYVATQMGY